MQHVDIAHRRAHFPYYALRRTQHRQAGYVHDNLVRVFEDKRFFYDGHGRLIRKLSGRHTAQTFSWDSENRLIAVHTTRRPGTPQAITQTTRFDYDALGRRVARHDAFGSTLFIWEGMRLIEERRGSSVISYVYEPGSYVPLARLDALGHASEQGGLGTTKDATPGDATSADARPQPAANDAASRGTPATAANDAEARYWASLEQSAQQNARALNAIIEQDWGGTQPGPTKQPELAKVYYFHTNQVGLPEELTNAQGQIVWQASYKTWGNTVAEQWQYADLDGSRVFEQDKGDMPEERAREQNLRFQGQYLDRDTGLHYNTFRYYDPDIGRFISPDPIGLDGGINLGSYAPNPISWIDPWGWTCKVTTDRLKKHAAAARREVYSDPQRMLSARQRAAIKRAYDRGDLNQARSRYRRYVGSQIDKRFKALVDADQSLAGKVSTTPTGKRGPDVVGKGPNQGQWWDLTTRKDWDRGGHQRKYDRPKDGFGSDYEGIFWDE